MDKYIVYKHTAPNGKVYIGQTKKTTQDRWKANGKGYTCHQHGWFWKAIEKYGWENIKHEVLKDDLSKEAADFYEKYYISLYKSTDKRYGYNCQTGGSRDYRYNEESKKNISVGLKKRYKINPPDTSKARAVLQKRQGRHITQYDLFGNRIAEYESAYDAYLKTGISNRRINGVLCAPKRNFQAGGYMWCYGKNLPDKIEPCKIVTKPVILLIDGNKNVIDKFLSQREASNKLGISQSTVGNILQNKFRKSKVLDDKTLVYEYEVVHEDIKLTE